MIASHRARTASVSLRHGSLVITESDYGLLLSNDRLPEGQEERIIFIVCVLVLVYGGSHLLSRARSEEDGHDL